MFGERTVSIYFTLERHVTFNNMMKPGFEKMKIFSKEDLKKSYVFQDLGMIATKGVKNYNIKCVIDESSDVLSSVFDDSFLSNSDVCGFENNQEVSSGGLNDSLVFKSASLGLDDGTVSDPGKDIARLERFECHRVEVTSSKKKLEDMLKDLTDHARFEIREREREREVLFIIIISVLLPSSVHSVPIDSILCSV